MSNYSISVIPIDKLITSSNGTTSKPWNDSYHSSSGDQWNWQPWTISYSGDDIVDINIQDQDADPDHLNDDSWWNGAGRGSQTIQSALGYAAPGDDITDEYELKFTAIVDGVEKTYTLAAIAAIKPTDSGLSPKSYIGFTFDGEWPPSGTQLTYVPNSNEDSATLNSAEQQTAPCFAAGTKIQTPNGPRAIEDLTAGMMVLTKDHGAQAIQWIGSSYLAPSRLRKQPELRPIRIKAGALGDNTPQHDLVLSPQHRVLVRSKIAMKMFGTADVLVAAKQLLQLDGVDIADDLQDIRYFHMLFAHHEVILSNGAESESLYTGPEALKAVGPAARNEIFAIFPELKSHDYSTPAARQLLSGRQARRLAIRHIQNQRALVM